jgi:hypothetical protein
MQMSTRARARTAVPGIALDDAYLSAVDSDCDSGDWTFDGLAGGSTSDNVRNEPLVQLVEEAGLAGLAPPPPGHGTISGRLPGEARESVPCAQCARVVVRVRVYIASVRLNTCAWRRRPRRRRRCD